jgi:hypothetical protein
VMARQPVVQAHRHAALIGTAADAVAGRAAVVAADGVPAVEADAVAAAGDLAAGAEAGAGLGTKPRGYSDFLRAVCGICALRPKRPIALPECHLNFISSTLVLILCP